MNAAIENEALCGEVNTAHRSAKNVCTAADQPNGIDDVSWRKGAADDFR